MTGNKSKNKRKAQKAENRSVGAVLPLRLLLISAPFLCGLFYESFAAAAAVYLLVYLIVTARKNKGLSVPVMLTFFAAASLVLILLFSPLWAADRGMAVFGFVKFLPLPLFVTACFQISGEERTRLFDCIPWCGTAMVLISAPLSYIPALTPYFQMSNRLGGFFQYPNTFACYLMAGMIVLLSKERWKVPDWIMIVILAAGILYSGSRTVLILLPILLVMLFIFRWQVRRNLILAGAGVLAVILVILMSRKENLFSSIIALTAGRGSLANLYARLLYAWDAAPVILSHPLGTGYLGYYFMQGSFQTGAYSVMHLHNDFLQILMDAGWIPGVLFAWAVIRRVIRKDTPLMQRLMIIFVTLHLLMDYDMQFVAMDLILLLALIPEENGKIKAVFLKPGIIYAAGAALSLAAVYLGTAQGLYHLHRPADAVSMYPGHTLAHLTLLTETETAEEMEKEADLILALDKNVSLAHSAKARVAFSKGNIEEMIREKKLAVRYAKYDLSSYLDYLDMLNISIRLYQEAGDTNSARYVRDCALEVPSMIEDVIEHTGSLGWKIHQLPEMELPENYRTMLETIQNIEF